VYSQEKLTIICPGKPDGYQRARPNGILVSIETAATKIPPFSSSPTILSILVKLVNFIILSAVCLSNSGVVAGICSVSSLKIFSLNIN